MWQMALPVTGCRCKWTDDLLPPHRTVRREGSQSFRFLRSAQATLSGIETILTIKRGHIHTKQPGFSGKLQFINELYEAA